MYNFGGYQTQQESENLAMIENKGFILETGGIDTEKFNITRGSIKDLIELVKINDGNGTKKIADGKQVPEKIGSFTGFSTEITLNIGEGKVVKYIEPNEIRDDIKHPYVIFRETRGILLRGIRTAQERLAEIKEGLPEVIILGPEERMGEGARKSLPCDINENRIEAYPNPGNNRALGTGIIIFPKNFKPLAPRIS